MTGFLNTEEGLQSEVKQREHGGIIGFSLLRKPGPSVQVHQGHLSAVPSLQLIGLQFLLIHFANID